MTLRDRIAHNRKLGRFAAAVRIAAAVLAVWIGAAILPGGQEALAEADTAGGPSGASPLEFYGYDRTVPLDAHLVRLSENPWYRHFELTYASEGDTVICHYFEPIADGPKRALVGIHGMFSPREDQFWFIADFLARRGFAVLMPSLPYHHRRAKGVHFISGQQFIVASPQRLKDNFRRSVVDIRRGLDWLASRPGIRADDIGIVGASLGGMIAALAYKVEERFSCGVFIVAGGGLSDILDSGHTAILNAFRKAADLGLIDEVAVLDALSVADPATVPEVKVRDVLMFNGRRDIIFPVAQVEALFRTLGRARVVWADSGHFFPAYAAEYLMVEFLEGRATGAGGTARLPSGVRGEVVFEEVPRAPVPGEDRLWVDITVRPVARRHLVGVPLLNRVLPTVVVERSVFERWGGHGWKVPATLYVVDDLTALGLFAATCYVRDMGWLDRGLHVVLDARSGAAGVRVASYGCAEAHLLLSVCAGMCSSSILGRSAADDPAPLESVAVDVSEFDDPAQLLDYLERLTNLATAQPLPALPEDDQTCITWPEDFVVEGAVVEALAPGPDQRQGPTKE